MIDQFEQETKTTFIRQSSLGGVVSLSEATNFSPRVLTTQPLTWGQTPKILAPNVYWLHSLESYRNFFWARNWFLLCVIIIVIVHHAENSAQMSISSAHAKFANPGRTNAFLMRANEHYAVNLRGVDAQLRAQTCPSNRNTGHPEFRLDILIFILFL